MLEGKQVAVVVPAYDEQSLVADTIRGIPAFVDRIYVVDDGSKDGTADAARGAGDGRVTVLAHDRNSGVRGDGPHHPERDRLPTRRRRDEQHPFADGEPSSDGTKEAARDNDDRREIGGADFR